MKLPLLLVLALSAGCTSQPKAPSPPPAPPATPPSVASPATPATPAPAAVPRASGKPEVRYYEISDA